MIRTVLILSGLTFLALASAAQAQTIRSQAVVNLTFDEATGPALDSATTGAVADNATLMNGATRIRSPFWGQSGRQAVVLDAAARQFIQIPDSADTDRPDAVSFSLLYSSLHPAGDAAFHGLIGKRQDAPPMTTNYGINYTHAGDTLQLYLNDAAGFKSALYPLNAVIPSRRPAFLTAVYLVGDAPAPDADTDKDDVMLRLYVNGQPVTPKSVSQGFAAGPEAWLTDVKVATLVNDIPLTLGSSTPTLEFASSIIDEFSLFSKALSPEEATRLFSEVVTSLPDDGPMAPAAPQLAATNLLGLQSGATTTVVVQGANLMPAPKLLLPVAIAAQTVKPTSNPNQLEVEVTLAAGIPSGHYAVRVQTAAGVSNALPLAIEPLPQLVAGASTREAPLALPVALSGTLAGQQVTRHWFAGKSGQRFVADLECKRIGSAMSPVLELRSVRGTPLVIEWGHPRTGNDPRIEATLPEDGVYAIDVHDLAYAAPGPNLFRLKLGDLQLADAAFPPVITAGTSRPVELVGIGFPMPPSIPVDGHALLPGMRIGVSSAQLAAPAAMLSTSASPEFAEETKPAGELQTIDARFTAMAHVPVSVSGRLQQTGEVDTYLLQVQPGMTLRLTVDSRTFNSPMDGQISVLQDPSGQLLAISEDKPTLDYAVPAGVSAVRVGVADLSGRGGPQFLYRLRIVPAGQPDFSLSLDSSMVTMSQGGNDVVLVNVARAGYGGPIALSAIAPGVTLTPSQIPAGVSKMFVAVSAEAAQGPWQTFQIRGESVGLTPALSRAAAVPVNPRMQLVAAGNTEIGAVLTGASPLLVDAGKLPAALFKGIPVDLPVSVRAQGFGSQPSVRLTLLTTEATRPADPKDPNKGALPLVRSLPEQSVANGETTGLLRVAVPLNVAEPQINCVIKAEIVPHLFSNNVLATVYSRPFILPVQPAVAVQLPAPALMLKGGSTVKFAGTVKRAAGYTGPVSATILNLPAGYSAPAVEVPAGQENFEATITVPAVAAAADIPNVVLRISGAEGVLQDDVALPTKAAP